MVEGYDQLKRSKPSRDFRQEYECEFIDAPKVPPRQLSIDPNQPEFNPCYCRVGVRINGEERNDIQYYDLNNLSYMTTDLTSHLAQSIDVYWRYFPSRQQRRFEESWARKHKK